MDNIKYRRYVVSGAKYCCIKYIHTATDVLKGRSREMVRTGQAYYLTVFSSCRERFLSKIKNEINKFAKFSEHNWIVLLRPVFVVIVKSNTYTTQNESDKKNNESILICGRPPDSYTDSLSSTVGAVRNKV